MGTNERELKPQPQMNADLKLTQRHEDTKKKNGRKKAQKAQK
jgi:hypothetical protein